MADFVVNDLGDQDDADQGAPPFDGTCDTVAGDPVVCTLRAAIEEANATAGHDTITFSVTGTHNIAQVNQIDTPMTIDGNGSGAAETVIDGGDLVRVFRVTSSATPSVTFKDLRIEDGFVTGVGSLPRRSSPTSPPAWPTWSRTAARRAGAATASGRSAWATPRRRSPSPTARSPATTSTGQNFGAGISSAGALTLTRTTVSGKPIVAGSAVGGGGIVAEAGLTVVDSTISGNSISSGTFGTSGGGISSAGATTITKHDQREHRRQRHGRPGWRDRDRGRDGDHQHDLRRQLG